MMEFLTSRSRRQDYQFCPRARWILHEAADHGWEPVRQAVPLVTGASVHAGLAFALSTLRGTTETALVPGILDAAVGVAVEVYEQACRGRGFDLAELEDQSYVYQEQRALVEALVRLAGLRVIPALLATYEVLEVETMDKAELANQTMQAVDLVDGEYCAHCGAHRFEHSEGPERPWTITWRSIPDALLRTRDTHELYILSWKTLGEYGPRVDDAARVDMQGVSEMWALGDRLKRWLDAGGPECWPPEVSTWFVEHAREGWPLAVRGVQMAYLVKGQRRKADKATTAAAAQASGNPQAEVYKTASPLIYAYVDKSFPPKLAWSSEWRCHAPHPMARKSQWYPSGECPGDGRRHPRGDDWTSVPVWTGMGIAKWIADLDAGTITPEAGDCLDQQWALPVPYYRTQAQVESWLRQTRSAEVRVAQALTRIQGLNNQDVEIALDEEFPQHTAMCASWFGRKCPGWEICHGPDHVHADPAGSGLYQVKTPYHEKSVEADA